MPLAIIAVALFWLAYYGLLLAEVHMFPRFMIRMGLTLALALFLLVLWLRRTEFSLATRLGLIGLTLLAAVASVWSLHHTVLAIIPIQWSIEAMLTFGVLWLAVAHAASIRVKQLGLAVITIVAWLPGPLVRMEGLAGNGNSDVRWRWTPTAEENFLATVKHPQNEKQELAAGAAPLETTEGDWPAFHGPTGDSRIAGVRLVTDWSHQPPIEKWKQPIGPGWSSILVIGDRLFTQEQRGELELTTCYSAESGEQLWAFETKERFEESMGGVGPRATPAFAGGRIYSLGARGRLDCLDAATGKLHWTRDARKDCEATLPMWGYSTSPVVVDDKVAVFLGGEKQQALAAYQSSDGSPAWKSAAGEQSYSSPIVAVVDSQPQVLYLGDKQLSAFSPATGKLLWLFASGLDMGRPSCQPQFVSPSRLLLSFEPGSLTQIELAQAEGKWSTKQIWKTTAIKPDFSDYLVHDGFIYGFDGDIFCCVDLETGKRRWKGGRYGAGQALLLADQGVILVITEKGELALVECTPAKHTELARMPAIAGKTWNHPAYSRGRLYVRNAEEMACFELPLAEPTERLASR